MARRSSKRSEKARSVKVDMTGVKAGGRVTPGRYRLKVSELNKKTGEESGKSYIEWQFEVVSGKHEGASLYYNTSLQPQALWNLRGVLEALEVEVPDDEMDLDFDELEGMECGGEVELETYEGKRRPRLVDFFTVDELEEGEGEDRGDELSPDDVDEMDEEDLEKVIEQEGLDVDLEDFKKLKAKREAVKEALEEAREAKKGKSGKKAGKGKKGKDEDEEEETPRRGRGKGKKAKEDEEEEEAEKVSADDVNEMSKKELEALVEDKELEVETEGSIRRVRRAVIKALKAEDLLEEEEE